MFNLGEIIPINLNIEAYGKYTHFLLFKAKLTLKKLFW